ncbi:MAG: hypothetical protein J6T59_04440 [Bacteroidales bacterium]|nr:hypothetical protein [Bacteroidales bacterium]
MKINQNLLIIPRVMEEAFEFLKNNASKFIKDTPENQSFIANPDAPAEHKPKWHQFGIITHTRKFAYHYDHTLPQYLKEWGLCKKMNVYLDDEIDRISKNDLLRLSIPFHDLGKFTGRFIKMENGQPNAHFNGHEKLSEELIRGNRDVRQFFVSQGLTDLQIDYIAQCAGLHYELGKIRDIPKKRGEKFTIAFIQSQECKDYCLTSMKEHPGFKVEMGILYICDSLAKTDIIIEAESDEEIAAKSDEVAKMVSEKGLHPKLSNAIMQLPVNIAFAHRYLSLIP